MKTLTTLFFTAVSSIMLAQIPNNSFETWSGGNPAGWYDLNSIYSGSVTQSAIAESGSSSVKVSSVNLLGKYYGGILGTGILTNTYFPTGTPNPAALTGWYQFNSVGGDEVQSAVLTKVGGSNTPNGAGSGKTSTSTGNAWKQFTICIFYSSGTADSASIIFSLTDSTGGDTTHAGTYVLIDNLSWGTCTSGVEDINSNVAIEPSYPNPANEFCNIIYSIPGSSTVNVSLYDLNGRKVMNILDNTNQTPGRYKIPVDVSKLANGVYIYTITVDGVPYTQKLVVAK